MPDPTPDFRALCLEAARDAAAATVTLVQAEKPRVLRLEESPELLASALASALNAAMQGMEAGEHLDRCTQLRGALDRFLDGWAR